MSYAVRAKVDTWLKVNTGQGSQLSDAERAFIQAGASLPIVAYALENNHFKVTLGKNAQGQQIFVKGRNTWYLYAGAVDLLNNGQVVNPAGAAAPKAASFSMMPAQKGVMSAGDIPIVGINLIKEFEGYERRLPDGRVEAYADPIHGWQVPTIGYGTTVYPDGSKVKPGDIITRAQAEAYLIDHIQKSTKPYLEKIPTWSQMNDNQRGAIYSFAYNLGAGFYRAEGFASITRVCDSPQLWSNKAFVREQFIKYRDPGTSAEAGLLRRREAEAALFCT